MLLTVGCINKSAGFVERTLLLFLLFWSISSRGGETRHTSAGEQNLTRHRSALHQVNVRRFSLVSLWFLSLFSSSVSHPASIVSFTVIPVVPPLLGDCDRVNQCLFLVWSHSLCAVVHPPFLKEKSKPVDSLVTYCCCSSTQISFLLQDQYNFSDSDHSAWTHHQRLEPRAQWIMGYWGAKPDVSF